MSAIIWTDVTLGLGLASLQTVPVPIQNDILSKVNGAGINAVAFGGEESPNTRLARIYLAAHLGQLVANMISGEVNGVLVSSESTGGISRSYSVGSADGDHNETIWGQLFDQLVRSSPGTRGPIVL